MRLSYLVTPEGVVIGKLAGVIKGELSLRKRELLKWSSWNHISKDFLQKCPDDILLVSVSKYGLLDQCQTSTKEVYDWLCSRTNRAFIQEITEFREIQLKIRKLEQEIQKLNIRSLSNSRMKTTKRI